MPVVDRVLSRRDVLVRTGALVSGGWLAAACSSGGVRAAGPPPTLTAAAAKKLDPGDWKSVRAQFALDSSFHHLAGFLLSSHPAPVRSAIDYYRAMLDANPSAFWAAEEVGLELRVLDAVAAYLGGQRDDVALTESTTMGLALVGNGLSLRDGDEVLTTAHDHYSMHESLRFAAARNGATVRHVTLYRKPERATANGIVESLVRAVRPATRIVAVTWVHSSTGVRLPIPAIAIRLAEINKHRSADDQVLLLVDGVHGLGAVDLNVADMGCDMFVSGTHKWLFGPRGTGLVWAKKQAWRRIAPTIPSFDEEPYVAWIEGKPGTSGSPTAVNTPGGFHAFEHRWAVADAFEFHKTLGRGRVSNRIATMATRLKSGLVNIPGVRVVTPASEELSAGIVCCEVEGKDPGQIVDELLARKVTATVTPYAQRYLRFGTGIYCVEDDVDAALDALADTSR